MMTAAAYGRLGQAPKRLDTNSGKLMVDSIVSAKSVWPGGRKPQGKQQAEDFDDYLAF